MKLYKFTNAKSITRNNTKWEIGKTISIHKKLRKPELCSNGVLHAYKDLNLALLIHNLHSVSPDKIYVTEGNVEIEKWDKVGSYELTPKKEIQPPEWYSNISMRKKVQKEFALLCAESIVYIYSEYIGDNINVITNCIDAIKLYNDNLITEDELYAAYDAAYDAAYVATNAAAYAAANAADAACYAAYAAIFDVAITAATADTASYTADAANIYGKKEINFIKLAKQAIHNIKANKKEII